MVINLSIFVIVCGITFVTNAVFVIAIKGRLRGIAVTCWIIDHYHPCSNLGVIISEGCFIFDLASLHLETSRSV